MKTQDTTPLHMNTGTAIGLDDKRCHGDPDWANAVPILIAVHMTAAWGVGWPTEHPSTGIEIIGIQISQDSRFRNQKSLFKTWYVHRQFRSMDAHQADQL
jgi:hypothetical protein